MRIQVLKLITLLFVFAFSSHAFATIAVFWDGTGDGNPDTVIQVLPSTGFSIDLYADISDDGHGGLLSWGGLAQFDALSATALASTIDPNWFVVGKNDISAGVVDLVAGRIGSGLSGKQLLATIQFSATNSFTLSLADHPSPSFDDFVAADGTVYDGTFTLPAIEVQVVPIPGAALFFVSGIAGLIGFNRRKSS